MTIALADRERIPPKPDLLCTDVDYKGVIYGTQLAIHFFRKNRVPGGKIIATASAAAVVPHETYPEYDGAKAAVVNFVRATARILKDVSLDRGSSWQSPDADKSEKENITINTVCPGRCTTLISLAQTIY